MIPLQEFVVLVELEQLLNWWKQLPLPLLEIVALVELVLLLTTAPSVVCWRNVKITGMKNRTAKLNCGDHMPGIKTVSLFLWIHYTTSYVFYECKTKLNTTLNGISGLIWYHCLIITLYKTHPWSWDKWWWQKQTEMAETLSSVTINCGRTKNCFYCCWMIKCLVFKF